MDHFAVVYAATVVLIGALTLPVGVVLPVVWAVALFLVVGFAGAEALRRWAARQPVIDEVGHWAEHQ